MSFPTRTTSLKHGAWVVACALAAVSCSPPSKGALVLAVSTDMQTPKDLDLISVLVSTNGALKFDYLGRVMPDGTLTLPSTLAIVEPDDANAKVRVRVIAFQLQGAQQSTRVLRDVLTSVPHERTALLRIPLNFLDDGSGTGAVPPQYVPNQAAGVPEGDTQFDPRTIASKCDFDTKQETSINGTCASAQVDPATLPDYSDDDVFGEGGTATSPVCFDVQTCFAGAMPVAGLDPATCSFPLPAGSTPSTLNVALVTASTGTPVGGHDLVPLENDRAEGWSANGSTVTMPVAVCSLVQNGAQLYVDTSGACPPKTEAAPVCEPTQGGPPQRQTDGGNAPGADATAGDATAGDATVDGASHDGTAATGDAKGGDSASADGGEPPTDAMIDNDAPGGNVPSDSSSGDDGGIVGDDGGGTSSGEGGATATLVTSESGLFYGGCSPIVAGGKVFFCSAAGPLDGTQLPPPSATLKSVPIAGGAPTTLGSIATPTYLPWSATVTGGLFVDTTNVYFVDSPLDGGTVVLAAPIAGGSTNVAGSYGVQYGSWTFDGTRFYSAFEGSSCSSSPSVDGAAASTTCTTTTGLAAFPTGIGEQTYVMPVVTTTTDGGPDPYAVLGPGALGADPGDAGNVYAQLFVQVDGGSSQPLFVTSIAKSGVQFDFDAGPTGGLPELAPNLSGTAEFAALTSDGTYAYGLGFTFNGGTVVARIPTDGAAGTQLAATSGALFSILVDSGNAYWITATKTLPDGSQNYQYVGHQVMRVATSGAGSPVTIYDDATNPWGTPTGVAFDATYAYITTASGNLVRVSK